MDGLESSLCDLLHEINLKHLTSLRFRVVVKMGEVVLASWHCVRLTNIAYDALEVLVKVSGT